MRERERERENYDVRYVKDVSLIFEKSLMKYITLGLIPLSETSYICSCLYSKVIKNFTCKINLIILINKSNISQIVYYETSLLLFYQMTFDTIKLAMKYYQKNIIKKLIIFVLFNINKYYVNKQFICNLYF